MSRHHIPLLLAALLGGAAQAADCTPPEGFTPATSPVPLQDISKNESKHRVALLNIWAVWCAPCRKELPLLDAIAQDPGAPLDIITINLGDAPEQIGKIYDELHITALPRDNHGDHTLLKTLGGVGLPLSVWYLDGQMIAKSAGALHDGDALTAYARCLNGDSEGTRP